jgi:hypothetical protein
VKVVHHVKRFWRFHGLIAAAITLSAVTLGCAVKEPAYFEGTWIVTDTYQQGGSAIDNNSSLLLGRSIQLSQSNAQLNQAHCDSPIYHVTSLNTEQFETAFAMPSSKLGFDDGAITHVTLECANHTPKFGSEFLFQPYSFAYISTDDAFFKVEKAR